MVPLLRERRDPSRRLDVPLHSHGSDLGAGFVYAANGLDGQRDAGHRDLRWWRRFHIGPVVGDEAPGRVPGGTHQELPGCDRTIPVVPARMRFVPATLLAGRGFAPFA